MTASAYISLTPQTGLKMVILCLNKLILAVLLFR